MSCQQSSWLVIGIKIEHLNWVSVAHYLDICTTTVFSCFNVGVLVTLGLVLPSDRAVTQFEVFWKHWTVHVNARIALFLPDSNVSRARGRLWNSVPLLGSGPQLRSNLHHSYM
jgi:ethanolamine transporter EutH